MEGNMKYVIRNILYVGGCHGRGTSKRGEKYESRIGQACKMDVDVKKFRKSIGKNVNIAFENGKLLVTTPLVYIAAIGKGAYLVETENTMYIIERAAE